MKKSHLSGALCAFLIGSGATSTGFASIVDLPDVDGIGYFLDQSTGFTWIDIDFFFTDSSGNNITYQQKVDLIPSVNFHVATLTEIDQLRNSMGANPAAFASDAAIVGGNTVTRNIIWGWYDDAVAGSNSWTFKDNVDTSWQTSSGIGEGALGNSFMDLGLWAVCTSGECVSNIPVPAAVWLFGSGLLGLIGIARRK